MILKPHINKKLPWRSSCPECKSEGAVYLYDRGLKLLWRFIWANNRFVCARCNVTWRRRTRHTYAEIAECARRH
jgi:transposase-like protein